MPWADWESRRQQAQSDGGLQLCRVAPGFHMLLEHHFDRLMKGSTLWTYQKVTDKLKLVLADTSFHKQKVFIVSNSGQNFQEAILKVGWEDGRQKLRKKFLGAHGVKFYYKLFFACLLFLKISGKKIPAEYSRFGY